MLSVDKPLARFLLLLGLAVAVVAVRLGPRVDLVQPGGLLISDLDTLRRLARLEAIDASDHYPLVETHDGWPDGTTLHWTLPMDWVIRSLDPLVGWIVPGEKGYEGGAVLAGPLLAAAAACLLAALAMRLLGPGPGLVAGALYGLWYSFVNTSLLGNGDHQTLQQLAAVLAVLGILLAVHGAAAAERTGSVATVRWAAASGAALGFAVWVSTELMLLFYAFVAALTLAAAWPWRADATRTACRRLLLPWSLASLGVLLVGHVVEHRDDLATLKWDTVSWFQIWQVAVFVLFAALGHGRGRRGGARSVPLSGVVALAVGCLPLALPWVRGAVAAQLHAAGEVSVWLHQEVSEFRSLAVDAGGDTGGFVTSLASACGELLRRDGWLVLALPLAVVGAFWSSLGAAAALVLATLCLSTLALYLWEVKLGHLFALTTPLLLVAGWRGAWAALAGAPRRWCDAVAAALALLLVVVRLPGPRSPTLRHSDQVVREICGVLAGRRPIGQDVGVLAPWSMGAPLLYDAKVGAVATGYHRNLEGIRDGFRFWLTDVDDRAAAMQILHRRRVRFVVAWFDRLFLASGAATIGRAPLRTDREILPAATRTMFWNLRYGSVEGFRLLKDGPEIRLQGGSAPEPIYRIYEVVQ